MAKATQTGRVLQVKSPLGADVLLLQAFAGHDGLSQLFAYRLDLLSDATAPLDFSTILGQSVTVVVKQKAAAVYYNGIVSRFAQLGDVSGGQNKYRVYQADVVPRLWLTTQATNTRIFSALSVQDIVKQVLNPYALKTDWKLTGSYPTREYCVQYQETDFAFMSRLLEEEGIYYFFTHKDGEHTMVLTNNPDTHTALSAPIVFREPTAAAEFEDAAVRWDKFQEIRPGKFSVRDHQFEMTGTTFDANQPVLATVQVGTIAHKLSVAANSSLEVYEYPGRFAHHYDDTAPGGAAGSMPGDVNKDPARIARVRMEQETTPTVVVNAEVNLPGLYAGRALELSGHSHGNGSYVITRAEHSVSVGPAYFSGAGQSNMYIGRLNCIPKGLPFRPARTTPRPIIHGTQTATVVGGPNQNIFTDKYGRVKVIFPWDKEKKQSRWVRVAQLWSDQNWGGQFIPRGDQEVVVAFEEGDPDKPLIVGCVYNNKNLPPFALPDNATQSGIKSYCDGQGKFNQIRFEDKKDSEEVWLYAQKDYRREVLNNETTIVGVDGKATDGNQSITILKDRTVEVTTGNETFTIKKGNRTVEISEGNDSLKVAKGNLAVEVTKGNRSAKVTAGADSVEAGKSITLKVGGCSIESTTSGITIKAPQITIQADSALEAKGGTATIDGGSALTLKGGSVKIN